MDFINRNFQLNKNLFSWKTMPNEVTPVLGRKSITETSRFIALDWCESLNSCYLFFTGRNLLWEKIIFLNPTV